MAELPIVASPVVAKSKEQVAYDLMCYLRPFGESERAKILDLYHECYRAVRGEIRAEALPRLRKEWGFGDGDEPHNAW